MVNRSFLSLAALITLFRISLLLGIKRLPLAGHSLRIPKDMSTKWDRLREFEGPSFSKEDVDKLFQSALPQSAIIDKVIDSKASIVMIGESSHGTQEHYAFRAELTKQLIEKGLCNGVFIEGDFPDTADLHHYVNGCGDSSLMECLEKFERFPSWMWGNTVMRDFAIWLRDWNLKQPIMKRCGLFGLDLYSLHLSMQKVLEYLNERDKDMEKLVRKDYSCFGKLDPQTYGMLVRQNLIKGCEDACLNALKLVASNTQRFAKSDPANNLTAIDSAFFNEINARVVCDAEHYYRAMFSDENSWNIRDSHFFDTLQRIRQHLQVTREGRDKAVVWAHNSHLGDARFTHLEQKRRRDLNIGQLVKESYPKDSICIGQLFNHGKVCAADEWGMPHEFKKVNEGLPNSYEDVFHHVSKKHGISSFALDMSNPEIQKVLEEPRLERAIGVIYKPDTERWSHYYFCNILKQFDLVAWTDVTSNVIPLEEEEKASLEPETFPSGL